MFQLYEKIDGIFIMSDTHIRKTQSGTEYMTAMLIRGNERIKLVLWESIPDDPALLEGGFVYVKGTVGEYRNEKQVTAESITLVDPTASFDRSQIVPCAPIDATACFAELTGTVSAMEDEPLKSVCEFTLASLKHRLLEIPAAKGVHHAFLGGLLMHVTTMLRMAKALYNIYTSFPGRKDCIDPDTLYAGIILHDIGKVLEFNCYACGLVEEYSVEGKQFGHSVLGVRILENVCKIKNAFSIRIEQVKHMLLSHHGSFEHGAAVEPMTIEAIILSQLDGLDSKTEAAIEALTEVEPGGFSERIFAFDGRQLYKPRKGSYLE